MEKQREIEGMLHKMDALAEDIKHDSKTDLGVLCMLFNDGKITCKAFGSGLSIVSALTYSMVTDENIRDMVTAAYQTYVAYTTNQLSPLYDALANQVNKIQDNLLGGELKESPMCLYSAKFAKKPS
jgi:hypothetical protein